jgi:hypothetical protein
MNVELNRLIFAVGWAEIIGPIVVLLFYIIGHLLSSINNKPVRPQQPAPKLRDPDAPPQPPRTLEEKLRNEVEEFLRQVQGDQPKPARPGQPVAAARPVVVKVAPEPADSSELELVQESVQQHVARHISTADISQHTATLGAVVGQADDRLQSHLQEKFQHQIGALAPKQKTVEPRRRQNTAAAEIAQLLRTPSGVRQVVIASEILRRPEV